MIFGSHHATDQHGGSHNDDQQFPGVHFLGVHSTRSVEPAFFFATLQRSQSPAAGDGAAGSMPDADSFPAPDHFSTI